MTSETVESTFIAYQMSSSKMIRTTLESMSYLSFFKEKKRRHQLRSTLIRWALYLSSCSKVKWRQRWASAISHLSWETFSNRSMPSYPVSTGRFSYPNRSNNWTLCSLDLMSCSAVEHILLACQSPLILMQLSTSTSLEHRQLRKIW